MFSTHGVPAGLLLPKHMSDESSPETSPNPPVKSAPRARRVSTPRPKKVAKSAEAAQPAEPVVEKTPAPVSLPESSDRPEESKPSSTENDWPEPEAASAGQQPQQEGAKRKRRRRKGKGQSQAPQNGPSPSQETSPAHEDDSEPSESSPAPPPRPQPGPPPVKAPQQHQQQQSPRPRIDPEHLAKMAWKIYLAEVSEEGVALIGDNDAKDLSRRCFRLAEIFIEEQSRRR